MLNIQPVTVLVSGSCNPIPTLENHEAIDYLFKESVYQSIEQSPAGISSLIYNLAVNYKWILTIEKLTYEY